MKWRGLPPTTSTALPASTAATKVPATPYIGTYEPLMTKQGIFFNLVTTHQETSAVMATSG
jgi:hypothetical protein